MERRRWIASITSGCCASTASPRFLVQSTLSLIIAMTSAVLVSALTLLSHDCFSTSFFNASPFKVLRCLEPAIGLHHFERIGRRCQHICQQFVGIERNRRNQRLELFGLQQLCTRRRLGRRLRRAARSRRIVGRLGGDGDRISHQQRERDKGLAAAEHHTLLGLIAASIGPRRGRSLIKIKETNGTDCCGARAAWPRVSGRS